MKNRIAWIDFVRASGMVMIIIVHSLAGIYGSSFLGKVLFAVNVPVFFILSGYLFKEKKLSQVIKGGFFNLILPYVFSAILIALIEQAYSIFPSWVNEFSAKDFVKGALYRYSYCITK
ncbi:acyltransferase family protein [Ligilactobacillus agilis]|uniref:acyltransferase family protein n=1 Tax=Ligilactobacillus agilis TaxID=1601 RepID=UPI0022DE9D69|nr:acyltransferase family protein [Ligilactobacillus agilis]